jgi:hypothetical protein
MLRPPSAISAYEILPFTAENLYKTLSNEWCAVERIRTKMQAIYLGGYLSEIRASTIIVENEYIDRDYLEDYAAYYARCFKHYSRWCKRIHFFSTAVTEESFRSAIQGDASPEIIGSLTKSYLGFVIARPLPEAIIGRTLLVTYEPDGGRRNYPCQNEFVVNLFGLTLSVRTLPFQEQDTVMAACATVALWCCFHRTRELFASASPTPAEITRLANQVLHEARPIPSHGLIVQQICNAIRQVGLEPEVIQVKPETPLPSLIYAHLKFGLPVVLGVEIPQQGGTSFGHAVALTGFSQRDKQVLTTEIAPNRVGIPMAGLRIDEFYAHDDGIGPFSRIIVQEPAPGGFVTFQSSWKDRAANRPAPFHPTVVIIPIYNKIRVTFLDVHAQLLRLHLILKLLFSPAASVEWDVYLTTTNSYKETIRKEGRISKEDLIALALKAHPKYIWRAVLMFKARPLLELLLDATDMARSLSIYHVHWHDASLKRQLHAFLSRQDPQIIDALNKTLGPEFLQYMTRESQP